MSEAEASDLALKFNQFDLNDDGKLDAAEVAIPPFFPGKGLSGGLLGWDDGHIRVRPAGSMARLALSLACRRAY